MSAKTKKLIKSIIPPIFLELRRKLKPLPKNIYGYFGNYKAWQEAENDSAGYDSDVIISKVANSARMVRDGQAVYERDSVIFDQIQISWPLLAGLLLVYAKEGRLEVLDFGGSLGTSYFQNRSFLSGLLSGWNIVEQKKFAEIGKKEFSDSLLHFYPPSDIEMVMSEKRPNTAVISSSLQFVEDPYGLIKKFYEGNVTFLLIDKIPFHVDPSLSDRIMVQKVPPKIYDASYPVRIFGLDNFKKRIEEHFSVISQFDAYNGDVQQIENGEMHYLGFICRRK